MRLARRQSPFPGGADRGQALTFLCDLETRNHLNEKVRDIKARALKIT
jgi:hypothetical protein